MARALSLVCLLAVACLALLCGSEAVYPLSLTHAQAYYPYYGIKNPGYGYHGYPSHYGYPGWSSHHGYPSHGYEYGHGYGHSHGYSHGYGYGHGYGHW